MFGLEPVHVLLVMSIFFFGGWVKGVLGFGLPLITMSLLPFVIPVELAIVLSALVQPLTNIGQLAASGGVRQAFRIAWPVIITLLPGVALGAWYLTSLQGNHLLLIVGITVIAFSTYNLTGLSINIPDARKMPWGMCTGFIAGIIGSLTSINGPFFIMYLMGRGEERQVFRSTIALLFVISGSLISSGFWAVGLLNKDNVLLGLLCLLPCFAGMWHGNLVGEKIPAAVFRKIILLALLVIGSVFIFRSF